MGGASLPRASLEAIVRFVEQRPGLVLAADEVYQENVYGDAPPFISFKKIVRDLNSKIPLVSFHSISKGFTGECGLRGGYFELTNIDTAVKAQLTKLASVSLCSNTMGQAAVGLMVNPPTSGPELRAYEKEKKEKLASLERRANKVAAALDALEGVSCVRPTRSTRSDCSKARASSRCPARGSARRTGPGTSARPFYRRRSRSTTSCRSSRASTSRSWPSTAAAASSKEGVRLCNAIVPRLKLSVIK